MSRIALYPFRANTHLSCAAWFLILALSLQAAPPPARAAATNGSPFHGILTGAFDVSPAGAATYRLPIEVPPGIGGLQPSLSLAYNSHAGNGRLGVGWSLDGLSAITRCPATLDQDGFIDPVNFTGNDRFCLDGQRLVEVANTGCAGGSEYRTEIDAYARICSHGAQGSGPSGFRMWTKAGHILDYGNTEDSRMEAQGRVDVLVWALNRTSDTVGNYLDVAYHEDGVNGEYYPLRIEYTGNAAQGMAPYFAVQFLYQERPDVEAGWVAGSRTRGSVRMTNVQVQAGGGLLRDYHLDYELGTVTGRSRLVGITLCNGAGYDAECLPTKVLSWSEGAAGFEPEVDTGWSATGSEYAQVMDVDGDGKADLVYCTGASSTWQILISDGNGFNSPINTGRACTNYQFAVQIDYDADGRMDLLVPYANGRWYVLRSTGTGFALVDTGIPNSGFDNKPVVMDATGDGRHDLVLAYNDKVYLRRNNGNGFGAAVSTGLAATNWQYRLKIDYDADGRMDLLVPYANGRWYVMRSTGNGFQLLDTGRASTGHDNGPQVLDVNGDGLQDLVVAHSGRWWILLNRGNGFASAVDAGAYHAKHYVKHHVLDYNGDGKPDLVVESRENRYCSPGMACPTVMENVVRAYLWTGDGFDLVEINGGLPWGISPGDFNGNGYVDLAFSSNVSWRLKLYESGVSDRLRGILDQPEIGVWVDYEPISRSMVYTPGPMASYPQQRFQAPLQVVSKAVSSDGIGGSRARSYYYTDARFDLRGRGFLGFREISVLDESSRLRTVTEYRQDFPYVGLVLLEEKFHVDSGSRFSRRSVDWEGEQPYPKVHQVRKAREWEMVWELGASLVAYQTVLVYSAYDLYGNPGRVLSYTDSSGETFDITITENIYAHESARWHIGRLERASVTGMSVSGVESRVSSFEHDPVSGLLSAEVVEPDDPQLMLRTEYGYDGYGNRSSVTVRDSGGASYPISVATSLTEHDYGQLWVNGTYAVQRRNAKGHAETQIMDARFGKPLSLTGPNGLVTQWEYDDFGRMVREIRADGTESEIKMMWCDSVCAGLNHALYRVVTTSTGTALTRVYHDSLGRELRHEGVSLGGQPVFRDTEYNNLGQVARVSRPYLAGDLAYWTEYQYDAVGRIWKELSPDGGIVETTHTGLATSVRRYSINDAYDQTVTQVFDRNGNLLRVIDEGGQTTAYEYDSFNNLIRVADPAGNATVMTYDRRGRKLSMNEPNMGAWEYRYDALGQLRWQKDAKGQIITMNYDVLGRMVQRVQPEGTSTWTYDTRPYGIGKLSQINGMNGYIERHYYNAHGRPRQVRRVVDGTTLTTTTAYDAQGRVGRLIYPSGFAVRYQYNTHGHLYRLVNHANTAERYWTAQAADADGHITQELLGNGLSTVRTFDPASGRLTYLGTFGGNNNVQALNYQFDALGNLRDREDYLAGLSESFQYDAFNRLTQATIAGVGTKAWSYDWLGNITSKDGHSDYAYTSGRPHAVSYARASAYSYDANGNMTAGGGRIITWTSDNKPKRITRGNAVAEFNYSPDGARYKQVSTGGLAATTLYAGSHHERVTANGVTTHKDYLSAAGRVVAIRETSGETVTMKYLHQDHLGSTDVVTDADGQVLERMSFDAFGSRRAASNWNDPVAALIGLSSTRGFTGHEQLDGVGLIHMNGRVYDPALGRFLSADPYVGTPANPQNLNRYSYVNNNPLSYTDPSGYFLKKAKKAFKSIGKVVKKIVKNPIVQVAAAAITGYYALALTATSTGSLALASAVAGGGAGFTYGVANGGLAQGLQYGITGALAGYSLYQSGMLINRWADVGSQAWRIGTTPGSFGGKPAAGMMVGKEAGYHATNWWVRNQTARVAHKNDVSLAEMNLGLFGLSAVGNVLPGVGSRYDPEYGHVLGVNTRGKLAWPFDAVDALLEFQGLPSASGVHVSLNPPLSRQLTGPNHSLGALTVTNQVGLGALSSGRGHALPFGNVAPSGVGVTISSGDPITGFFFGLGFNPDARLIHGGFGRHGACSAYGQLCQ